MYNNELYEIIKLNDDYYQASIYRANLSYAKFSGKVYLCISMPNCAKYVKIPAYGFTDTTDVPFGFNQYFNFGRNDIMSLHFQEQSKLSITILG